VVHLIISLIVNYLFSIFEVLSVYFVKILCRPNVPLELALMVLLQLLHFRL